MMEYLGDLWEVKSVISICAGLALVLGFVFMVIVKYFAGCIVWFCIVAYFVMLLALAWSFR